MNKKLQQFELTFLYLQHFKEFAVPFNNIIGGSLASACKSPSRDRPCLSTCRCLLPTSAGDGADPNSVSPPPHPPPLLLLRGVSPDPGPDFPSRRLRRSRTPSVSGDVVEVASDFLGFLLRVGLACSVTSE